MRLLIPLGVAALLFFAVDFLLTARVLMRPESEVTTHERRRTRIFGLAGLLLLTVLGVVAAVTFTYRHEMTKRETNGRRESVGRPLASQGQIRAEMLAFLVPFTVGAVSGVTLRWMERVRRRGSGTFGPSDMR